MTAVAEPKAAAAPHGRGLHIDFTPVGIDLFSAMNAEAGWMDRALNVLRATASALFGGMPLSLRVETLIAMVLSALSLPTLTRM